MEQKQTVKTHRVGTVTFGCLLIVFGTLFLVRLFAPDLNYEIIFRLWPCLFIFLGLEVLAANRKAAKESTQTGIQVSFLYDKTAIFLMICLFFFAMAMAFADYCIQYDFLRYGEIYIP